MDPRIPQPSPARPRTTTTTPKASFWYDDGEYPDNKDVIVRGARWQRTGLLNAHGQSILKRIELPIGFAPYDPLDMYAIEDLD